MASQSSGSIRFASPLQIRFVIDDFSNLQTKKGEILKSSIVEYNAYGLESSWQLQVYPKGDNRTQLDSVSIFFHLIKCNRMPITVQFRLEVASGKALSLNKIFDEPSNWGWDNFIARDVLLSNPALYLPNDKLTVVAEWSITIQDQLIDVSPSPSPFQLNAKVDAFRFYDSELYSDCKIRCVDKSDPHRPVTATIPTHRFVLSLHSSVFAAELTHGTTIDVDDVTPQTMRHLLRLLYSGTLSADEMIEHAENLLIVAKKFQVHGLIEQLDRYLSSQSMTFNDAVRLFPIAGAELRSVCVGVFELLSAELLASDDFNTTALTTAAFLKAAANDKSFSDCVIRIVDSNESDDKTIVKEFPAHRLVLAARSDVFKAMFRNDSEKKPIDVDDVAPADMENFLKALYGQALSDAELDGDGEQFASEGLLHVATKYSVDDITTLCARHLAQRVTLDNVIRLVKLADRYRNVTLKAACLEFVAGNAHAVVRHSSFVAGGLNSGLLNELFLAITK